MPYHFKKGGIINETGAKEIPLPLTKQNLKELISGFLTNNTIYTSQDFANWCTKHHDHIYINEISFNNAGIDEATFDVIQDVDANWDLFLIDNYNHEDLQKLDLSKVRLPNHYFISWLKQLE